VQDRIRVYSCY